MKPLQEIYQIFVLFSICSSKKRIGLQWKFFHAFISLFSLIVQIVTFIASFNFVIKYFSIDLTNSICAFYQIAGTGIAIYTIIISHIKCDNLKEIFDIYQSFYNACK